MKSIAFVNFLKSKILACEMTAGLFCFLFFTFLSELFNILYTHIVFKQLSFIYLSSEWHCAFQVTCFYYSAKSFLKINYFNFENGLFSVTSDPNCLNDLFYDIVR